MVPQVSLFQHWDVTTSLPRNLALFQGCSAGSDRGLSMTDTTRNASIFRFYGHSDYNNYKLVCLLLPHINHNSPPEANTTPVGPWLMRCMCHSSPLQCIRQWMYFSVMLPYSSDATVGVHIYIYECQTYFSNFSHEFPSCKLHPKGRQIIHIKAFILMLSRWPLRSSTFKNNPTDATLTPCLHSNGKPLIFNSVSSHLQARTA